MRKIDKYSFIYSLSEQININYNLKKHCKSYVSRAVKLLNLYIINKGKPGHRERRDCPDLGNPRLWRCTLTERCREEST
jgi:hypothetical protein